MWFFHCIYPDRLYSASWFCTLISFISSGEYFVFFQILLPPPHSISPSTPIRWRSAFFTTCYIYFLHTSMYVTIFYSSVLIYILSKWPFTLVTNPVSTAISNLLSDSSIDFLSSVILACISRIPFYSVIDSDSLKELSIFSSIFNMLIIIIF